VKATDPAKQDRKPRKPNSGDRQPNPLISPTEKCKVCREPAAKHIHYGAVTCFSCRAFFRRSIQNQTCDTYKCRKQGNCEITLKSRKSCQRCRFDKCLEVGMKSSWVLSEEERFRRFRKHREKVQQQQLQHENLNGSSPPNGGYYDGPNSGDESEDARRLIPGRYSPDPDRKFGYGRGSPSYLSPPPLSPLNSHLMGVSESQAMAAASQVPVFPGMDLNILRAAAAAHAGHSAHASHSAHPGHSAHAGRPPFVPPPHFMAMASASADAGLMGGLSSNHAQPGPSSRSSNIYQDRPQTSREQMRMKEEREEKVIQSSDDEFEDNDDNYSSDEDRKGEQKLRYPRIANTVAEITPDELAQIKAIARIHDINYKSVNFGEELIK